MTKTELESFVKGIAGPIAQAIKNALDHRVKPVEERLVALEADVEALKARPELKHCGVFRDQSAYEPGSLVTRSGGLWLATARTAGAPGADPSWRLVVKSGHAQ